MKTRSFVAIASFFVVTSLLYCSVGMMSEWPAAFASRRVQTPGQQVAPKPAQQPQPQAPAQPLPQKPVPIEHRQPERVKRDELSKKLELRREEIKAEKKERVKKQQEAQKAQDED